MIYLLLCALLFSVLALHPSSRFEWCTLAVMTFVNFILTCVFDSDVPNGPLYQLVPIVTSAGAMNLLLAHSKLGYYQAGILCATLCAYAALAFDVSQGEHVLIYNNYEAVIYGLVGSQLIGIFPTVWSAYRDLSTGRVTRLFDLQRVKRS